jgi:hypothetical protein
MMRRTPMTQSTKPMKRSAIRVKVADSTPVKAKRKSTKVKQRVILNVPAIWRSDDYLAAVRSIPCIRCGAYGLTEAAHSNQLRFGKGRGLKSSDATAMALCRSTPDKVGCHAILDQGGSMPKLLAWQFEYRAIVATVNYLICMSKLAGHFNVGGSVFSEIFCASDDCEVYAVEIVAAIESGTLKVVK